MDDFFLFVFYSSGKMEISEQIRSKGIDVATHFQSSCF